MGYEVPAWMMGPFGALLALIALAPLLFADWWGRHYPKVAFALAAITLTYYLVFLPASARQTVAHTAAEYISFIALIGSLFVVSSGIHINVKGEATPLANTVFLGIGALVANLLGTTGASMLLIRPWLRMNKYRVTAHHVVFFIFVVSNVGGALTPIGDPPLFLGYLKGVPFWWVAEHCWPMWMTGVGILLAMFYVVDLRNYRKAPKAVRQELAEPKDEWRFQGLANLGFLAAIIGAVFVNRPAFLREAIMLTAALGSYVTTQRRIHEANQFNFHPIKEVAILFIGIFATMMPALDWLQTHAQALGDPAPAGFYWVSGTLSSVLDNAPTYLSFLSTAIGALVSPEVVQQVKALVASGSLDSAAVTGPHSEAVRQTLFAVQKYFSSAAASHSLTVDQIQVAVLLGNIGFNHFIVAISIGSVFFGANTYIGNGPNFMVKSIAEHQKVHVPSFLGYVFKFTMPFMVPMLVIVWWFFFRS